MVLLEPPPLLPLSPVPVSLLLLTGRAAEKEEKPHDDDDDDDDDNEGNAFAATGAKSQNFTALECVEAVKDERSQNWHVGKTLISWQKQSRLTKI